MEQVIVFMIFLFEIDSTTNTIEIEIMKSRIK